MATIELNKKDFINALSIGGFFAGKNRTLPILECVKLKVNNGNITIVSTDTENAISKKCEILSSDGECTFCVNYKDLSSYVKLVSGEVFKLIVGESEIEVQHEKGNMTIPLFNADEFPLLKMDENSTSYTFDSATINNWIVDAKDFIGDDELRAAMQYIYFYSEDGEFGCCSTDGRTLFTDNVKLDNGKFSFMLNKGAFKPVCDVCKSSDSITLKLGDKNVMFIGDNVSVISRLSESRFPNFKMVIPNNTPISVKLNKSDFIESINRVKVGANNATCLIKIDLNGISLKVSAQDFDFNRKTVEYLRVDSTEYIKIGFNANKLLTALNAISSDNVILNMIDGSKPCIMREDNENSNKIVLLMPMLLDD